MESWPIDTLAQCFGEAGARMQQFFELAFDGSLCLPMNLARMRSLLVVGDSGIACALKGKSASIMIAANHHKLNVIRVSIGDLVGEYPNQLEKGILQHLNRAKATPPSIVVLDNIEIMFPKHGLTDCQLGLQALDQLQKQQDDEPVIIGCCLDLNGLDDDIRNSFDETIQLQVPTPEERFHLFQNFYRQFDICQTVESKSIATRLHSYKIADVYSLFRLANEKRCIRGADTISEDDFLSSIKDINAIGKRVDQTAEQPEAIKWSDIGGLEKAKSALMECTAWMHDYYVAYERLGGSPTKGVLLYGPPGTGKTLLAKAIANECSANFLAISIPELIKGEVGESEKSVARIFTTARRCSPCVIFLDELEAIFGSREATGNLGNKLISQLIMELDNINHGNDRVLIVTATNHPEKIDRAILRPGRLDQHIFVALPSKEERLDILKVLSRKSNVDDQIDFKKLANMTEYFTGADMQALLRKAGLCALKRRHVSPVQISEQDFINALSVLEASVSEAQQLRYSRFELTI